MDVEEVYRAAGRPAALEFPLPESSDVETWTPEEKALLSAAGLWVKKGDKPGYWADRGTIAAFFAQCRRTGLDPIAKQIYAIERGGRWGIQASIDGFRVVAQRSRQYEGQVPIMWTGDGRTWTDVWLSDEPPAAARAGVWRSGFREPLLRVARWKSFAVYQDVWEDKPGGGRRKTNRREPAAMWGAMPEHMLGKVAEAQALRAAFPMDLSGLYIAEEMEQEWGGVDAEPVEPRTVLTVAQRAPLPQVGGSTPAGQETAADGHVAPEGRVYGSGECAHCGERKALRDGDVCADCEALILEAQVEEGR